MTLNELYVSSLNKLSDIDNATTDLKIIIKKVLGFTETDFILNKNCVINETDVDEILCMVEKRISGIPVQYIIGEWDFFGLVFKVNENVLIPRPETEILCEFVINYLKGKKNASVADLCAGSGCIGVTVKKNAANTNVILIEKSPQAVKVCAENICKILGDNSVKLKQGDIFFPEKLEPLPKFDLIISNPPYIKTSEIQELQSEVQLEPKMALDGGEDGLDFYRLLAEKWTNYLSDDGMFAFECGENQADEIKSILENKNFDVYYVKDYNDIDRFVIGKRRKI